MIVGRDTDSWCRDLVSEHTVAHGDPAREPR